MDNKTNRELGEMIESIAAGNISRISEIYKLLGKVMYAVARIYVSQTADVEDIIHDALLKIVKQAKLFRENKNAYAWINTIVKNAAKDFVRKKRYRDKVLLEKCSTYELEENDILVREALGILSKKERDLLMYLYWYEMTYAEIAHTLRITKSAVKKRTDKVLGKIKSHYKN